MKVLIAYMPVLHQGYLEFVDNHPDAEIFLIFGKEIVADFDWLVRKDIRAVCSDIMRSAFAAALQTRGKNMLVDTLNESWVERIKASSGEIVFADEEESRHVASTQFEGCAVSFDRSVKLRWDKPRVLDQQNAQGYPVTTAEMHRSFMRLADVESQKSADFWLSVGALLVTKDGSVFVAYNRHLPSDHEPYTFGDPRSLFKKGVHIELSTAAHAEPAVIAAAARCGVSTEGAVLYVTTFPCPPCAKLLSQVGLRELYFKSGYSMLEGEEFLRKSGIQLFRVQD